MDWHSPDGWGLVAFARFGLFGKMEPRHRSQFVFRYNRRFYHISLEVFSFVSRSIQTHFAGRRSQSPSPSQKSINGDRPAQFLRQRGLARTDWLFLWGGLRRRRPASLTRASLPWQISTAGCPAARHLGLSIGLIWLSSQGTLSLPAPLQLQSLNPNNLLKHDSVGG